MLNIRYKDLDDLIAQAQNILLSRNLDRIETIWWEVPEPTPEECDAYFSQALAALERNIP
jgi:hypothetical protein